jgi:DNA polymerase-3 subunit gamma/tau
MLNLIDEEIYFNITEAILDKKFSAAFNVTQKIYDNGWNFIDFSNGLIEHFRNILTVVIRKDTKLLDVSQNSLDEYLGYKNKFSEADLVKILAFLNTFQYELKNTANQKLKTEISLASLIALEKSSTINQLIEFVSQGKLPQTSPSEKKKTLDKQSLKIKEPLKSETVSINKKTTTKKPAKTNKSISSTTHREKINSLLSEIKDERTTLEDVLDNIKFDLSDNQNLKIISQSKKDLELLKNENAYLKEKIIKIFGNNIEYKIELDQISNYDLKTPNEKETSNEKKHNELIIAIVDQLGGKEYIR